MLIERNFSRYVVFSEDTILTALNKISANQSRLIFAVSEGGILEGVMTDGDFRRWIADAGTIDLTQPVAVAINRSCVSAPVDSDSTWLQTQFSKKIQAIPLLDHKARLVAIAFTGAIKMQLANRQIGEEEPVFIIAEIGNNHNGDISLALQLVDAAAKAGADCVKFQMRDLASLYGAQAHSSDPRADLGAQYTMDLLERFQLSDEELYRCFDHAEQRGLIPLCTPWDENSIAKLESYGLPGFKIASADFTNHTLIRRASQSRRPIVASTGMATDREVVSGIECLRTCAVPFALLHCNSTYPTPFKDVNLHYMQRLRELADAPVGYSGHERGGHIPLAAVALGAAVIEKHLSLDRRMEGNDHRVSLLPHELEEMVRQVRDLEEALGQASERSLSQGERMNREVLGKSLVATITIPAQTPITAAMVAIRSPGQGLEPYRLDELLGRTLKQDKLAGELFFPTDLGHGQREGRNYHFSQPFGLPVRYHDLYQLTLASNLDLVEVHLSYKDLEVELERTLPSRLKCGLVVHAPELFSGDHTLDLCSQDEDYRQRSIAELQKVFRIAEHLQEYFAEPEPVRVVVNVGGFSEHCHLDEQKRKELCRQLCRSLEALDYRSVELLPQTMPPFPWHFGGQRFHNLFLDASFIKNFCKESGLKVCLDVSHSRLACNHAGDSFTTFLTSVLPYTSHLHLADAAGVDGEGLQIGEGEVDWSELFTLLEQHAPQASFIPEIWQGHKNGGEGFWIALECLEKHAQSIASPLLKPT